MAHTRSRGSSSVSSSDVWLPLPETHRQDVVKPPLTDERQRVKDRHTSVMGLPVDYLQERDFGKCRFAEASFGRRASGTQYESLDQELNEEKRRKEMQQVSRLFVKDGTGAVVGVGAAVFVPAEAVGQSYEQTGF